MPSTIDAYFAGERAESLLFLAVGLVACVVASVAVWRRRDPLLVGLAVPLALVGLIQVGVGATIYARTPGQVASLQALFAADPAAFKVEEGARMQAVRSAFAVYKGLELAFIVVGLALAVPRTRRRFWRGVGLGMLLQGALMLPADLAAEGRADTYMKALQALP